MPKVILRPEERLLLVQYTSNRLPVTLCDPTCNTFAQSAPQIVFACDGRSVPRCQYQTSHGLCLPANLLIGKKLDCRVWHNPDAVGAIALKHPFDALPLIHVFAALCAIEGPDVMTVLQKLGKETSTDACVCHVVDGLRSAHHTCFLQLQQIQQI